MKLKDKLARLSMSAPSRERGLASSMATEPSDVEVAHEVASARIAEEARVTEEARVIEEARVEYEHVDVPEGEALGPDEGGARASDVRADDTQGTRIGRVASLRAQLEAMRVRPPRAREVERPMRRTWREEDAEERLAALAAPPVDRTLPGERVKSEHGPLCRVVVSHDEDHRHGSAEVARARRALGSEVALLALDPTLEEVDFSRALFIDTETTGLAGGAGTLPFLIGMAWFEGEGLVVEQLLLERPGLEGPMLGRLAERLRSASVIVSYNGKSFDWPLLRTRFILNRIATPALAAHLDLLHCARRVFKSRLGSVRLVYLEQELLGFERVDDIPGELIPETYLGYLRGRVPGAALTPILDHNRSDLVALPALLGEILRRFCGEHGCQDARDQLGFARVAARGSASERAIALAHGAVEADVRGELSATAYYLVGELKQRRGELQDAIAAFERALEASITHTDAARAHLALAKLHEHKTKQYDQALRHARNTAPCEGEEACARRAARLADRIDRRTRSRPPPDGAPSLD